MIGRGNRQVAEKYKSSNQSLCVTSSASEEEKESPRLCVDYQSINKNTVPDQYPLLRVDE